MSPEKKAQKRKHNNYNLQYIKKKKRSKNKSQIKKKI